MTLSNNRLKKQIMSKFKLNWGWSILLVYITFMLVFLFFFYKSFKELKTNELVTKDYYEKELVYGDVIKKRQNADTMRVPVKIFQKDKNLVIEFPPYVQKAEGKIILYKPDNSKLDQEILLKLDEQNRQVINHDKLVSGRWDVIVDWQSNKVSYLKKEKMTLN